MWGRDGVRSRGEQVKLLYVEWVNNKGPLHSTETHLQHPVINRNEKEFHNEKEYKKVYKYNRVTLL